MHANRGDWLIVATSTVDRRDLRGYIEDVMSDSGEPPYRVRWTGDDHVSIVCPGPDARVVTTTELAALDDARATRFAGGSTSR
jgi:hypothetical protein